MVTNVLEKSVWYGIWLKKTYTDCDGKEIVEEPGLLADSYGGMWKTKEVTNAIRYASIVEEQSDKVTKREAKAVRVVILVEDL